MKKFFGMILIAGALVSCDNSSNNNETVDSTAYNDSVNAANAAAVPPTIDTTNRGLDTTGTTGTNTPATDTLKK
jgi:uncharacterized protein YcfL